MGYGGAKGGSKGAAGPYGKAGGKGKRPKGPTGPELSRERLTAEKFTGEVTDWRGKFGYITPSEPIEHEAAAKKGGKIWASMADIESGATELAVGQEVSFHVYLDDSGVLGAEEIEEIGQAPKRPRAAPAKGASKGASSWAPPTKGKSSGKSSPPWQAASSAPWNAGGKGKGKDWSVGGKGKDKGKGKGKDRGPRRASGAELERERLTAEKFTGVVVSFKGKFGYIQPDEEVDHPDAKKKDGKVWVSVNDIEGDELTVDQQVSFHIYTDASGVLGAEEVE